MRYLKPYNEALWVDSPEELDFLNLDFVKEYIKSGKDINVIVSGEGDTPLLIASYHNKLDVVKELIKAGADMNIKNEYPHDLFDYLKPEFKKIIIDEFPEQYEVYLMKNTAKRYNL